MIQLEPRRHEPPPGWPPAVFEAVTDAIAAALVASVRRAESSRAEAIDPVRESAQ
jgi:hypothetical protein